MAYPAKTILLGICASLLLHALGLLMLRGLHALPDVGIDLVLPSQMQFGVIDGQVESPPPSGPLTPPPPSPAKPSVDGATGPRPSEPVAVKRTPPPKEPVAAEPLPASGALASFAPKGAQIALRLDLDRIRDSALSSDVGSLLSSLPDVRFLLDGSGIDPLADLSRLFLATPDLQRSHVVMAGRYRGDERVPRAAVESLARAHGEQAAWRQMHGIAVAPWHNADATARVLALIGPQLFAITREEDLARVLGVARSLARRKRLRETDAAQSLVSMGERELLALSIENARAFVRGPHAADAPDRVDVSIRQDGEVGVEVESHAEFPNHEQAEAAKQFWDGVRERYANHALVALLGLDGVLRDIKLTVQDARLDAHTNVSISRARLLLGFARDALDRPMPEPSRRHDVGASK